MNKLPSDIAGQGARNECNFSPWEKEINVFSVLGGGGAGWGGGRKDEREDKHRAGLNGGSGGKLIQNKGGAKEQGGISLLVTEVRVMLSKADRPHPWWTPFKY